MPKHPRLMRRGSVFYHRALVPDDIRGSYGKSEETFSLKTRDPQDALRLVRQAAAEVDKRFAAHRRLNVKATEPAGDEPTPTPDRLTPPQIQDWCDTHYREVVDADFAWRADLWAKTQADPAAFNANAFVQHPTTEWYLTFCEQMGLTERFQCCVAHARERRLSATRHALAVGDTAAHGALADAILASHSITVSATDRMRLIRRLMETEIAALQAIEAQDASRYDAIVAKYAPSGEGASRDGGPQLESLVAAFLAEGKLGGLVKKTTKSDKTDLREFVEIVGDKPIRHYTLEDGAKYKDTLIATPAQRKVAPFTGLNIAQAAQEAERRDAERKDVPRLHVDTINDKLMVVRKFFIWASGKYKQVPNPIEGLRIKTKRRRGAKEKKRYPFTTDELNTLFNGPMYTGCKSARGWKEPGRVVLRDSAMFWVPLIGLFTGMRLGEIIQLRVSDVQQRDGIQYFDARVAVDEDDDEGAKSLKNENSARWIPIHPMLFALGFRAFLEKRRTEGSVRLFPDFKLAREDDSWSKTFSKWFGRYRRHLGITRVIGRKDRVAFHSFRHNFEDAARNLPDVKKDVRDAIQGHGEGGISEDYGTGFYLTTLNDAMQKIMYPGLDLGHLEVGPAKLPDDAGMVGAD